MRLLPQRFETKLLARFKVAGLFRTGRTCHNGFIFMKNFPIPSISRREALKTTACGFGYLAFSALASRSVSASNLIGTGDQSSFLSPLAPKSPHFQPKAKRVIFMFMQGGPSHLDTFDYKPELIRAGGVQNGGDDGARGKQSKLLAPVFKFSPHGQSGLMISELFPNLANHADRLCLLNGMHTDNPAHPQATILMHTGSATFVRPSMGSWILYGLGTENQSLPGFVTINPNNRLGGAQNYGSAFLPASYQGVRAQTSGESLANIRNKKLDLKTQRRQLDLIQSMNQDLLNKQVESPELEGVIESYELAFRMQSAAPKVFDLQSEPQYIRDRYGVDAKTTGDFGTQCLMARRLAEAGVRFIQVNHNGWDQHNNLSKRLSDNCAAIDQPISALLTDLQERGMLEDTLVVWGGEFGRSPDGQGDDGRRHNNRGFTVWMAGGGVRGGVRYGSTDETGGTAVENKTHIHDLHATILHLLGMNHTGLTYRYAGRDFRLTDVHGMVQHGIIS
jgi:uncharacterized protein (DUF1501 family)